MHSNRASTFAYRRCWLGRVGVGGWVLGSQLSPPLFFPRAVWTATGPIMVLRNHFVAFSSLEVHLLRWYHLCFSFDYRSGEYEMVLDGDAVDRGVFGKDLAGMKRKGRQRLAQPICGIARCTLTLGGDTRGSWRWGSTFGLL